MSEAKKDVLTTYETGVPVWVLYVARCSDDSLYCGITTDVIRRVREHNGTSRRGSAYCRSRRPVHLVFFKPCASHSAALREERAWKAQTKQHKEAFLQEYYAAHPEGSSSRSSY